MKDKYLNNFKEKTKDELIDIVTNPKQHNEYAVAAAHELLRKKTTTFSEYQELTNGKTNFSETVKTDTKLLDKNSAEASFLDVFLSILKWIGIILFFPMSLVVIGYYKSKKSKKEYYAMHANHKDS